MAREVEAMGTTTILRVKIRMKMKKAMEVSAIIYNSALLLLLVVVLIFIAFPSYKFAISTEAHCILGCICPAACIWKEVDH